MKFKLAGIKSYYEPKTGKTYRYHRKTGTRLMAEIGTPEFLVEWHAAQARIRPEPQGKPGSLGLVIEAYRQSHEFLSLQKVTRQEYERCLKALEKLGTLVMNDVTSPDIVRMRDNLHKSRNRSMANKSLAILSILFAFAIERGLATSNPVLNVKKVRRPKEAKVKNRPWTKDELDTVFSCLPDQLRLPVTLARWTGLRLNDILTLNSEFYDGKVIRKTTAKRRVFVTIPVAAPLKEILDRRPNMQTEFLCLNSRNAPWTADGFKTSFFKFIRALEAESAIGTGLTLHGLRHTVATELRELGFDLRTIADMLGQKSVSMAEHYSRSADLQEKLKPVVEKMENAEKTRTELSRKSRKPV